MPPFAMAPAWRGIGSRIASSSSIILSRGNGYQTGIRMAISSLGRGSSALILRNSKFRKAPCFITCRGQFSVSAYRYAKASAAAAWDEAADIYFAAKEGGAGEVAATAAKDRPNAVASKRNAASDLTDGVGSSWNPKDNRSNNSSASKRNAASGLTDGVGPSRNVINSAPSSTRSNAALGSKDGVGSTRNVINSRSSGFKGKDSFGRTREAQSEEDDIGSTMKYQSRPLPNGMQRLKRGYGRTGSPLQNMDKPGRNFERYHRNRGEEEDRPSEVPPLRGEAIYGIAPVRAALQARRRDLHVLYIQEKLDEEHPGKRKAVGDVKWVLRTAKSLELKMVTTSKHVLNMLVDNRPHQGMVLDGSPLELVDVEELERPMMVAGKAPVWVALDEVQDPQNFGAVLRSAYFFGVAGVVVCAKNSAPLSGVVSKASAGALEVIELLSCRNMVKFLDNSIGNGWRAIGSSTNPDCISLSELPKNLPTILVLGNEGTGVRTNVKTACTHMVRIGGGFPSRRSRRRQEGEADGKAAEVEDDVTIAEGDLKAELKRELDQSAEVHCFLGPAIVDSLNVSVAAGVLLHELTNYMPENAKVS